MKKISILAAAAGLFSVHTQALVINPDFDSNWLSNAPAAATAAIRSVDSTLGSMFSNNATVNITYDWSTGTSVFGSTTVQANPSPVFFTYSNVASLLANDAYLNPQIPCLPVL